MKTTDARQTANLSRRRFIVGSATVAGGGLALSAAAAFGIDCSARVAAASAASLAADGPEVTAWVVIKPDDRCVIRIARSEMGQGTMTGLAQLVVEELECDWAKVSTEFPTPGESLARKRVVGRDGHRRQPRHPHVAGLRARSGGAAARMMLLQAAADEWKVPVAELTVSNGVITHAASKRTTTLRQGRRGGGEASAPDPAIDQAQGPEGLEDRRQADEAARHRDQAQRRASSTRSTSSCRACAARPSRHCPVFGGKLVSFDEAKIAGRPGSPRAVQVDDSTVAVVADTWWRAKTALDALPIVWDEGPAPSQSSATIAAHLKEGLTAPVAYAMRAGRRCAEGDRRRREEGRGRLQRRRSSPTRRWSR